MILGMIAYCMPVLQYTPVYIWMIKHIFSNAKKGSIIVFHDSEKAKERMRFALPEVLKYFTARGFQFNKISALT
jgi:peptidoglycan/xylan/chitin deacetylase (PgdA/CDA1 family)